MNTAAVQEYSRESHWSGTFVFVLAVAGAAAGFGNIWKFPHLVGANGGGAFLLLYLLCLACLGLPLLVAEMVLGRRGRGSPVTAFSYLASMEGRWPLWRVFGWFSLLACCLLLSTYSVVGGWSLAYVFRSASGALVDLDTLQAVEVFQQLIRDPERLLAWHTLFLALAMMVVSRGMRHGLEEAMRWFMSALFLLLLALVAYAAIVSGHFTEAMAAMLWPDFSALTWQSVPLAMTHAFYTLTLGLGVVVAYSAYLSEKTPILKASLCIVAVDTVLGVLAGLVVFSLLFSSALGSVSGPALVFQSMPMAFGQLPNGPWFATLFFLMLAFAAWTSIIALLEPMVAQLVERRGLERAHATTYVGMGVWLLGVMALLSFSAWAHVRPLQWLAMHRESTLFDAFNFMAVNVLMPVAGLAVVLFVGWRISMRSVELELGAGFAFRLWRFLIRYVTPPALLVILVGGFI
jgi:NSS family neurotransmitter:Na+ symporter